MAKGVRTAGLWAALLALAVFSGCGGRGEPGTLYVSAGADPAAADGSAARPFATVQAAVDAAGPGWEIVVGPGEYPPFAVDHALSGTQAAPAVIRGADGPRPVIRAPRAAGEEEPASVELENVSWLTLAHLDLTGGYYGLYCESSPRPGQESLPGLTLRDCHIYDIRGAHGVGVYGRDPQAPIRDLTVRDCEIDHCLCGDSEALALNGNIDGFLIENNQIHDNNNIAIAMIGFEGTDLASGARPYAADQVRNGACRGNRVWNISTQGNDAYRTAGGWDLCAGGIYVDGGRDIEISGNRVWNCDIGVEVATEHGPEQDPSIQVSGVSVFRNHISGCTGQAGLAFGGYDGRRGFTVDCRFFENTLRDNPVHILVQRSRNNLIYNNTLTGGTAVVYNPDLPAGEMENRFYDNLVS